MKKKMMKKYIYIYAYMYFFFCLPVIGRNGKKIKYEEKIIFYDFTSSKIEENWVK